MRPRGLGDRRDKEREEHSFFLSDGSQQSALPQVSGKQNELVYLDLAR